MRRLLPCLLSCLISACSSGEKAPQSSPCEGRVYQLGLGREIDTTRPASVQACFTGNGVVRSYTRLDATGDNLCPGAPSYNGTLTPECKRNADCQTGEVCMCTLGFFSGGEGTVSGVGYYVGNCVPAACTSSSDCGGQACGISFDQAIVPNGLYCRSKNDACTSDDDCAEGAMCSYLDGRWQCAGARIPDPG